jgi:CheY-like chemotaxis protein/Tfp pilus assembly protein PilZ
MGVALKTAPSFAEAKKVLAENGVDVIVINYDNDQVNTPALCQHFKTNAGTKDIPIVITSVQSVGRQLKTSIKAGFDLFVEQPIPRQYFIEKLRSLLDQKTRTTKRVTLQEGHVAIEAGDTVRQCILEDISQTGILIRSDNPYEIGSQLHLSFAVPGYKKPIQAVGEVVRIIDPKDRSKSSKVGYGIRFISFSADGQKRLESYIEKTHSDDPKLVYYL